VNAELRRKVGWLMGSRLLIGTLLLGGATGVQVARPGSFPVDPFFLLIALTYGLTSVFALAIRLAPTQRWPVDVQFACDVLLVSAFICLTGGVSSVFSVLYVLPVIAASLIRYRRGGLLVAGFSGALFVMLVVVQYLSADGTLSLWWWDPGTTLPGTMAANYIVVLNVSGLVGVAFLTGSLADGARATDARLEQASNEIADLQALNQHVIDSLPSGLLTTDPSRRVLSFNHAAQSICGVPFQEVVGRQVVDVLQLPPRLVELLDNGLRQGAARRLEYRYRRPDGREIDIGLSATHLETPGGRVGYLVTFQDLTDIKKLERDARLQQRLAAVGEMAAGIAHEIRNPLASMSGSIQILRQELSLNSEQEQLMDIVLRESERLNTTIRSFLAYARPQRFAITRFDVRRAITDAALLLRNSAEVMDTHSVDVELDAEPLWCEADEGQIKQIVWNLASNGVRAMPKGGRLTLTAKNDVDSGVVLSVRDEGIGVSPEEIEGMFQPFHGSFARGSGLGLSIVHRIVTDYRGDIQVSSRKGQGTTVVVRLPVRAEVVT
jgi:two-component system, NtrC family, sensor histidine kinase PilS